MLKKFLPKITAPDFKQSKNLESIYLQRVLAQQIVHDNAQLAAIAQLQTLLDKLVNKANHAQLPLSQRLLSPSIENCQSLYIFGEVGRGKSMLMDLFYEACPLTRKKRVFFHSFMLEVHGFVHHWQQRHKSCALNAFAKKLNSSVDLLCFDEFHVTDIADAMILKRLFTELFSCGIVVVITSNRHPQELYQGGLQREQFLLFAKLLQELAVIVELTEKHDYRLSFDRTLSSRYFFPLNIQAKHFIELQLNELTQFAPRKSGVLQLLGGELLISVEHEKLAMLTFTQLCVPALGSADYLKLAHRFNTLIVTDIPKLSADKRNEAKRFVTLIDVLYEHKVKLICTAEVAVETLYTEGDGVFEFKRTVSRLMEMQSANYLTERLDK